MRKFTSALVATLILGASASPVLAVEAKAPAAAPAPAAAKARHYTTADTEIGTLLDDPEAKAIIAKNIPGMVENEQIEIARGMTLQAIKNYAPDDVTDARLAAIDAELAKLK